MGRGKVGIILAWDKDTFNDKDQDVLASIMQHVDMVKTGLQSITALDEHGVSTAFKVEKFCGGVAMRDWKLLDIGNTATKAFQNILKMGTGLVTLHAQMSDDGLGTIAAMSKGTKVEPFAVTVLTDLDHDQCRSRFGLYDYAPQNLVERLVVNFATAAYGQGIRGFVCSAQEARIIRNQLGNAHIHIATPAIRPLWAVAADEQKRVTTPKQAAEAGADCIVVGRPILNPPAGMTPLQAIEAIVEELDKAA